jgi:hypothetical protein
MFSWSVDPDEDARHHPSRISHGLPGESNMSAEECPGECIFLAV